MVDAEKGLAEKRIRFSGERFREAQPAVSASEKRNLR
jgi:hypothetical protein